jgi:hypothetical protein
MVENKKFIQKYEYGRYIHPEIQWLRIRDLFRNMADIFILKYTYRTNKYIHRELQIILF